MSTEMETALTQAIKPHLNPSRCPNGSSDQLFNGTFAFGNGNMVVTQRISAPTRGSVTTWNISPEGQTKAGNSFSLKDALRLAGVHGADIATADIAANFFRTTVVSGRRPINIDLGARLTAA